MEFSHGANYTKSARGLLQRLSDFRKGLHDERTRFRAGMGQGESWVVRALGSKGYEIYVDCARSVADSADASLRVLDCVHQVRELAGREIGLENGDLVEELEVREFGRDVDRFCFKDGTRLDEAR